MEQIKIVKLLVALLIFILWSVGLLGNMYSFRKKKFHVNPFLIIWCLCVFAFLLRVYVMKMYDDLMQGQLNLNSAVDLYNYLNIVASVANYISQLWFTVPIRDYYNKVPVFDTITYFYIHMDVIKKSAFLIFVKVIIFPIVIEINLILKQLKNDNNLNLLLTLHNLYPVLIANFVPNCAFGAFVVCRECTRALNAKITHIEIEANFYQDKNQMVLHKHYHRMQIFCNLADKLDELSEKFSIICLYMDGYLNLASFPILASLLCNLFGITAGLFQQYYAIADALINNDDYDVFNALTNGVFLIISFLEIALQAVVANECKEKIHETSLILKRIKVENCDIRFRQAVESFSLKILVEQFKIQPMGLLELNIALLHDVASAVTSFLLILIQTNLTLRFSLQ